MQNIHKIHSQCNLKKPISEEERRQDQITIDKTTDLGFENIKKSNNRSKKVRYPMNYNNNISIPCLLTLLGLFPKTPSPN